MENKLNPLLKLTSSTRTEQSSEVIGESKEAPLYVGPLTLVGDDTGIMVFALCDDRYLFVHNNVGMRNRAMECRYEECAQFQSTSHAIHLFDLPPAKATIPWRRRVKPMVGTSAKSPLPHAVMKVF